MVITIKLTRDDTNSLSSFKFYNEILKDVSEFYHSVDFDNKPPIFAFTENSLVDPIVLPLIISLGNYLKKFHNNSPINLDLTNNYSTNNLIKFLDSSDFFNLVGKNQNPTFPKGLNIFEFDERIPNDYRNKSIQRSDHKLRSYSLNDDNLKNRLLEFDEEESQRDFLIEYYTYLVENHFGTLLNDNEVREYGISVTTLCPGATESGFQAAAAMEESALVKGKKLPTAKEVAQYGYAAMIKGKTVAIHGFINYILANSVRFAPRALIVKITRKMQDKSK